MKKLFIIGLLFFLGFAPHVLANGFTALAPITGLTDNTSATSVLNSGSLAIFFNNLYKYLIGIAAILAVIQIIWAGIDMAFFHKDAVSAITDDKGKIYNAIFGLILVLSPVLVFSIINPSILNLSLNLRPIDLTTRSLAPSVIPVLGSTQTCQGGANLAGCVITQQAACTAAGGSPQTREGGIVGSETVTCVVQNQNIVPVGGSITANQCASLVGHSVAGSQGLQSTTVSASEAQNCNASTIQMLQAGYGYSYCQNITGGGVCLYNQ